MDFFEIILNSFKLIFSLDKNLYEIILLSLKVTFSALVLSSLFGLVIGFILALKNFFLKRIILIILNALMGIPPVVVGLIVYFLFARSGPFGVMGILYTPYAMIVAQSVIIFPIISSLSYEVFNKNLQIYRDQFRAFNIPILAILIIIIRYSYSFILTIILSGFGRAISEVGAVMIVGGNIEHYTRVMTTAITLQTRMGNLDYALALGIILIFLTVIINTVVYILPYKRITT